MPVYATVALFVCGAVNFGLMPCHNRMSPKFTTLCAWADEAVISCHKPGGSAEAMKMRLALWLIHIHTARSGHHTPTMLPLYACIRSRRDILDRAFLPSAGQKSRKMIIYIPALLRGCNSSCENPCKHIAWLVACENKNTGELNMSWSI